VSNNYFSFDGANLISEIRAIREGDPQFKGRRLFASNTVNLFVQSPDYLVVVDMNSSYVGEPIATQQVIQGSNNKPLRRIFRRVYEKRLCRDGGLMQRQSDRESHNWYCCKQEHRCAEPIMVGD
jgi:hypothetical protein